ncbi:MAG: hypothetical protein ACK55Z_31305, partial [bacterium]
VPRVPLGPVAPSFELVRRDHIRQAGVDVQHLGPAQHGPEVVEDPSGSPELCVQLEGVVARDGGRGSVEVIEVIELPVL